MRKYQHLFFDLDHTLWDFDTNARASLEELYLEFNLVSRSIPDFEAFYENYLHHNKILWERYQQGFIKADELKWRRMWRTLLEFKIGDEALAKEMSIRFLDLLPQKRQLFPYTREILQYLRDKDYVLHLITNGFQKTQWQKIKASGIDQFFTEVITSEASNSMKPEAEIFAYALKTTSAQKETSIMIGDNLEADIRGGMNAGLDTIFVNHLGVNTDINPTFIIHHLKELESIF
jgi:putative hydrolase of the HAD superfamily